MRQSSASAPGRHARPLLRMARRNFGCPTSVVRVRLPRAPARRADRPHRATRRRPSANRRVMCRLWSGAQAEARQGGEDGLRSLTHQVTEARRARGWTSNGCQPARPWGPSPCELCASRGPTSHGKRTFTLLRPPPLTSPVSREHSAERGADDVSDDRPAPAIAADRCLSLSEFVKRKSPT